MILGSRCLTNNHFNRSGYATTPELMSEFNHLLNLTTESDRINDLFSEDVNTTQSNAAAIGVLAKKNRV
jgi:hypothetical protein